jgi:hypothetical protein
MVSAVSRTDKGQGIRRNLRCALRFCARRRSLIVVGDGRLSSILSSRRMVEISWFMLTTSGHGEITYSYYISRNTHRNKGYTSLDHSLLPDYEALPSLLTQLQWPFIGSITIWSAVLSPTVRKISGAKYYIPIPVCSWCPKVCKRCPI